VYLQKSEGSKPSIRPPRKIPYDNHGSKPFVDQLKMEKELLELLQQKFVDDNSVV